MHMLQTYMHASRNTSMPFTKHARTHAHVREHVRMHAHTHALVAMRHVCVYFALTVCIVNCQRLPAQSQLVRGIQMFGFESSRCPVPRVSSPGAFHGTTLFTHLRFFNLSCFSPPYGGPPLGEDASCRAKPALLARICAAPYQARMLPVVQAVPMQQIRTVAERDKATSWPQCCHALYAGRCVFVYMRERLRECMHGRYWATHSQVCLHACAYVFVHLCIYVTMYSVCMYTHMHELNIGSAPCMTPRVRLLNSCQRQSPASDSTATQFVQLRKFCVNRDRRTQSY